MIAFCCGLILSFLVGLCDQKLEMGLMGSMVLSFLLYILSKFNQKRDEFWLKPTGRVIRQKVAIIGVIAGANLLQKQVGGFPYVEIACLYYMYWEWEHITTYMASLGVPFPEGILQRLRFETEAARRGSEKTSPSDLPPSNDAVPSDDPKEIVQPISKIENDRELRNQQIDQARRERQKSLRGDWGDQKDKDD